MRTSLITLALSFTLGCGGKSSTDDPLTGDWTSTVCYGQAGLPDNVKSCETKLTFTSDLNFSLVYVEHSPPASAVMAHCDTTHRVTGQKWSENIKNNQQTLTITGAGVAKVTVDNCVNGPDNKGEKDDPDVAVLPGDMAYAINGKALNVSSGSLTGAYTGN